LEGFSSDSPRIDTEELLQVDSPKLIGPTFRGDYEQQSPGAPFRLIDLLCSVFALAQTPTAEITGRITDPSGAVITAAVSRSRT